MTPASSGASAEKVSLERSMIHPLTYGPRSATLHRTCLPVSLWVTVTMVPIGRVRCAHVPGGAASYHDALPDWAFDSEVVGGEASRVGAGLGAAVVAGRGADVVVGAERRATVVVGDGARVVAVTRRCAAVVAGAAVVVDANSSIGSSSMARRAQPSERLARSRTTRSGSVTGTRDGATAAARTVVSADSGLRRAARTPAKGTATNTAQSTDP